MAEHHDRSSELLAPASKATLASARSTGAQPMEVVAGAGKEVDVLSDVLRTVRLTGALFFPLEASSPWADEIPAATVFAPAVLPGAQHVVSYHIVMHGACWATLFDIPAVHLETGDILVVPHGDPYIMSSAPGIPSDAPPDALLSFFRQMAIGSAPSVVTEGGGGPERADLVCGFLGCDVRPFNPVLETLPRLVHIPRPTATHDYLRHLIEFALAESRQRRSGVKCVLLRLSEVLFVEVVRRYLDGLGAGQTGWLAGLRDPIVGHALALLHDRPAHPWTLERLHGRSESHAQRSRTGSLISLNNRLCAISRTGACSSPRGCSRTVRRG